MMQFIERAEQLKIIDAGDEAVAIARSNGFQHHVPKFATVRFDVHDWANTLYDTVTLARRAFTVRATADATYEGEAEEVRGLVEGVTEWVKTVWAAARALELTDPASAKKIANVFTARDYSDGSTENVHGHAPGLVEALLDEEVFAKLPLPPDHRAKGEALLDPVRGERIDAWGSRWDRVEETARLHIHLDAIVQLLERYARHREVASLVTGAEIPDFGFAVLRASLAPRRKPDEAPAPDAAPAPAPASSLTLGV